MAVTDDLVPLLKKLRLSGVLQTFELRCSQAVDDDLSHTEFLFRLLSDEAERRDAKQLDQRIRRASFDNGKTLEEFDFHFNPAVPKAKVLELGTCAFAQRHENILLLGEAGVGKSHLAQALGHRACRAGYAVLYVSAHEMLIQLRAARADASYEKRLARLTSPDVLIIDDLGLRSLVGDEPIDLYEIVRRRYQRGSMIITSNRAVDEWPPLFGDPLLASAAMDRLRHDAHIIEIVGDSYRNPPPARRTKKEKASMAEAAK